MLISLLNISRNDYIIIMSLTLLINVMYVTFCVIIYEVYLSKYWDIALFQDYVTDYDKKLDLQYCFHNSR